MSILKTKPNNTSVSDFLDTVVPESKKLDGYKLLEIFHQVTGMPPILWGPSLIGFGRYSYSNSSGKTLEWFPVGFSPRKQSISIHLMIAHEDLEELPQLGKFKLGKGCIYFNKLEDVDETILSKMIFKAYQKYA